MTLLLPSRRLSRLPRGITAYWPLDASTCEFGSGQVRPLDLIGNNYGVDAKSVGAAGGPPYDSGGIGYNFNATTSTYCVLNSDPLQGTTSTSKNLTYAFWLYLRSYTGLGGGRPMQFSNQISTLVEDGNQSSGLSVGAMLIDCDAGNAAGTTQVVALNQWNFIAYTVAAGLPTGIYINGVGSLSTFVGGYSTSAVNAIGCRDSAARIIDGKMAHVMVCNRTVLTAGEIADLYRSFFVAEEIMPAMFLPAAGGSFLAAWARGSNLPVLGTGTY